MDAFYASIEIRNNPSLKNKPVIVGGLPGSRGVVATCSYKARKFGIHSAMPSSKALRLCPDAVFIKPQINRYKEESKKIFEIYKKYADIMEPLSLDEAFLDVTNDKAGIGSASKTAEIIKKEVFLKTGLFVSAGVSYNKFLAKIASDMEKPDGLTIITPKKAPCIIASLPVEKFFGVGAATARIMHFNKIFTGKDILDSGERKMYQILGRQGLMFHSFAKGIDKRLVSSERTRKSIGKEITLKKDILDKKQIFNIIYQLAQTISDTLKKMKIKALTATLKVRYHNFHTITRTRTQTVYFDQPDEIADIIFSLAEKTEIGKKKIRLVGISTSNFNNGNLPKQLCFNFDKLKK